MINAYPARTAAPEAVFHVVRITGAGAANPTKNYGPGVSVTWVSTGKYRVTFSESQGTLLGAWLQLAQNAPAAGSGQLLNVDRDSFNSTGFDFFVEDPGTEAAAPALADLASTDSVYLLIAYKSTAV